MNLKFWTWFNRPRVTFVTPKLNDPYLADVINFVMQNPDHKHYVVVRTTASKKVLEAAFQKVTNVEEVMTIGRATADWSTYESNCALSCATSFYADSVVLAQLRGCLRGRNTKLLLIVRPGVNSVKEMK